MLTSSATAILVSPHASWQPLLTEWGCSEYASSTQKIRAQPKKKKSSFCKSYGTATLCSIFLQYPLGYLRLLDDNADRVSNLPGPFLHKKLCTSNPASFRFADRCAQIFDYIALPGKAESCCASWGRWVHTGVTEHRICLPRVFWCFLKLTRLI